MDFEIIFKSAFCLVVGAKKIELLQFPLSLDYQMR